MNPSPFSFAAAACVTAMLVDPCLHAADPVLVGQWPGYTRGAGGAAVLAGNYAYVHDGLGGWQVLDFSDPGNPRRARGYSVDGYSLGVPVVSGRYAYVSASFFDQVGGTNRSILEVLDVSEPLTPKKAGGYDLSEVGDVAAVAGHYLYALYDISLQVFDIADPTNPLLVGSYATGSGLWAGTVSGKYAYLASGQVWTGSNYVGSLEIVDISSPASPNRKGGFQTGSGINHVVVSGHYAYVAADKYYDAATRTHVGGGLQILDVSDPAQPQKIGEWDPTGTASEVIVAGNYAFVAAPHYYDTATGSYDGGLRIIDISDPTNPRQVAAYDLPGEDVGGLTVSGTYAYLTAAEGLVVIDISDPRNPRRLGAYESGGQAGGLVVSGHYAYVADGIAGLEVIDISNPANPKWTAGYTNGSSMDGVVVLGNYAYVADSSWTAAAGFTEYLDVLDISDHANPKWTGGRHVTGSSMRGVAFSGSIAYAPAYYGGVQVFDLSDPTNPQLLGNLPETMDGIAYGVALSGHYAYVAESYGLRVADVSDPANPVEIARYSTVGEAHGVAMLVNYAYVATLSGLLVFDISNPSNPQKVGSYDTNTSFSVVAIAGNYAYLAQTFGGLQVIDISNPINPQLVGGNDMAAYGLTASSDFLYVAAGASGLQIFAVSRPTLTFQLSSSNLSLSWPSSAINYVIQSATTLANGGDWKDSKLSSSTVGDQNLVTVDTTKGLSGFFRLRGL